MERASGGHEVDPAGAGRRERFGARRDRRPGREDVVDEQDPSGAARVASKLPRIAARRSAPPPPRLRTRVIARGGASARPGIARRRPSPDGERPGLVVSALGQPSTRQRHPRDDVDGWQIVARGDRAERAPATSRHPENLRRCTARRAGPSKRNGERADVTGSGGQSRQKSPARGTDVRIGRTRDARAPRAPPLQPEQNGHGPSPHPAHRRGNTTSSDRASTERRYRPPPTSLGQGDLDPLGSRELDRQMVLRPQRRIPHDATPPRGVVELDRRAPGGRRRPSGA